MSKRVLQFMDFETIVEGHIENYTIPQYGDAPDDEVERWTPLQCVKAIGKYQARFENGRRGRLETLRDMVKIAHFACLAFDKMQPTSDEVEKIKEGRI